jgi:hypothetical protein
MRHSAPPALACWFLESVLPIEYRECMLGDLIEEFALRAESSSSSMASRWFWGQACRSVCSMILSSIQRGDWVISMGIAMGAFLIMAMLKIAADSMISILLAPKQIDHVVLAPIVFLASAAIGGCIAARIRRGATLPLALMVMISVAVLIGIKACPIPVPWWYPFSFLTLGPLAVLLTPAAFSSLKPRPG